MLSIMRFTTLDFAVVTPFYACFSSETQLKHEDLVHLLLDAARITAYRSTRRTEIDSKNGTRNEERKGRALGHVPAVKGGASWYPRAPRSSDTSALHATHGPLHRPLHSLFLAIKTDLLPLQRAGSLCVALLGVLRDRFEIGG